MKNTKLTNKLNQIAEELLDAIDFGKYSAIRTSKMKIDASFYDDPNDKISKIGAVGSVNIILNYEDEKVKETLDLVATVKFDKELKPLDVYCTRRSTGLVMFVLDIEKYNRQKEAEALNIELREKDTTPSVKKNKI